MAKRPDLLRRQAAVAKTMAKYDGRPFDWRRRDCLRMVRSHLVAMGQRGLPKVPRYSTAKGALQALQATGHQDLAGLLDSLLPRIAPAAMLPGDVAVMEGESGLDAVVICVGAKVWGWHGDDLSRPWVITPKAFKGAWRA